MIKKNKPASKFYLEAGDILADKYLIEKQLGKGTEGEVFLAKERYTQRLLALKLFYAKNNLRLKKSIIHAKKLQILKDCPIVVDFHSFESFSIEGEKVAGILSEYIEGVSLWDFLQRQRGKRIHPYVALHLFYALVKGVEEIHANGQYHGDLHTENIIIKKVGLHFDVKLFDLHHWGDGKKSNQDEDIMNLIRVLHEILGGRAFYAKQAPGIKDVICGLKRSLILKKFKTMTQLRLFLEKMDWSKDVI